jgi:hypothetical protein
MNQALLTDIYNQIKKAISGSTSHIYFLYLPSEELLSEITVTYELNNTDNENTFDSKEAIKYYSLKIKLNAPTASVLENESIYIKRSIYALVNVNQKVQYINLVTEELFFDSELNVFTEFLNFEIHYS